MWNLLGILRSVISCSLINESAYKVSYSYKNKYSVWSFSFDKEEVILFFTGRILHFRVCLVAGVTEQTPCLRNLKYDPVYVWYFRNRLFHKLFRCFLEANLQKTKSKTPELFLKKVLTTEVRGLRKQIRRLIQTTQAENLREKRANLSHSWNIKFWTCPVVRNDHLWSHVGYCLGSEVAAMALPGPLTLPLKRWALWNKLIGDMCLRNQNILGCSLKKSTLNIEGFIS